MDYYILGICRLLLTIFIYPLSPHPSQPFLDISIFPPPHTTPSASSVRCRNTYLYICSPHPLVVQSVVHISVAHTRHPSASAACLCAPLCMPASAAIYLFRSPPLFLPRPAPRSLLSHGEFVRHEALCIHVSPILPHYVFTRLLVSSGVWFLSGGRFHARSRGQGASNPWQSLTPVIPPPLLVHAGAVQDTPPPPFPSPYPPLLS